MQARERKRRWEGARAEAGPLRLTTGVRICRACLVARDTVVRIRKGRCSFTGVQKEWRLIASLLSYVSPTERAPTLFLDEALHRPQCVRAPS
eukprot:538271-Pleurochrysis_carterae.AAC.1